MGFKTLSRVLPWPLPPSPKAVLMLLAFHQNDATGRCDPSVLRLVKESGLGERTVFRALDYLARAKAVSVQHHPGRRSAYVICLKSPCHHGTPATMAPLPERQDTPATMAETPAIVAPNHKDQKDISMPELRSVPAPELKTAGGDGDQLDLFGDDLTDQTPAPHNPQAKIPSDAALPDLSLGVADPTGPKFILRNGSHWRMNCGTRDSFVRTFPAVDVDAELQKAAMWCLTNPAKRKTSRGMPAFINRWLGNARPDGPAGDVDGFSAIDRLALSI